MQLTLSLGFYFLICFQITQLLVAKLAYSLFSGVPKISLNYLAKLAAFVLKG